MFSETFLYSKKHPNQEETREFLKSYDAKTWAISPSSFVDSYQTIWFFDEDLYLLFNLTFKEYRHGR